MEIEEAAKAFAAIAHPTRLSIFRLLVARAPEPVPAGEIATATGVAPSTLSFHLAQLEQAGLVFGRRRQRQVLYAVSVEGVRRLIGFLADDCCQGRPEMCGGGFRRFVPSHVVADDTNPAR